jgi:hypothetical protein
MAGPSRENALDHVAVDVFENRSLDNVLGRLYGPGNVVRNFLATIFAPLAPAAPEPGTAT